MAFSADGQSLASRITAFDCGYVRRRQAPVGALLCSNRKEFAPALLARVSGVSGRSRRMHVVGRTRIALNEGVSAGLRGATSGFMEDRGVHGFWKPYSLSAGSGCSSGCPCLPPVSGEWERHTPGRAGRSACRRGVRAEKNRERRRRRHSPKPRSHPGRSPL